MLLQSMKYVVLHGRSFKNCVADLGDVLETPDSCASRSRDFIDDV
jgi:hypothetical protein